MSEPNSSSDPTPAVPPPPAAPSFTYGEAAPPPAAAPAAAPVAPPAPAYGVAAPAPAYGVPGAAPVYGAAPVGGPKRRTWDVVLTIILFVLAVIGAGLGVFYGAIFLSPPLLAQVLTQQGYGLPTIDTRAPGATILISHIVLFVLGVGIGIFLLVKKKIAFYVPLAAGVIAAIVFWVVATQVFLSIPGFAG